MPFYEYECKNCGRRFELLRSFSDQQSEEACPNCTGTAYLAVSVPSQSKVVGGTGAGRRAT